MKFGYVVKYHDTNRAFQREMATKIAVVAIAMSAHYTHVGKEADSLPESKSPSSVRAVFWGCSRTRYPRSSDRGRYFAILTTGGFQLPSRMASSGQYARSQIEKFPAGAGSQLDSFSLPGDLFPR